MQYDRTFPSEEAAHEWAKLEGFQGYTIVSRSEPIDVPGPMGAVHQIPNIRYFILYDL